MLYYSTVYTVIYCDLRSSLRRAVSKRTFYVSKRTFAVSKRTFAVSETYCFSTCMSCLGDEIDMFSRLKGNVWLLYASFTVYKIQTFRSKRERVSISLLKLSMRPVKTVCFETANVRFETANVRFETARRKLERKSQ